MISVVLIDSLDDVWQLFSKQIEKCLSVGAGSHYTSSYYYNQIKNGTMQLWVYHNPDPVAIGVISVIEYPADKSVFVELVAGGDLDKWLDLAQPLLRRYALQVGATTIEASCRPGLVKKLTKWRPIATLMRLDDGR